MGYGGFERRFRKIKIKNKGVCDMNQTKRNYWVLQGGHEFIAEMRNNTLSYWTIINHARSMKVGDKVILWLTGSDGGCCGLAEITEEPIEKEGQANNNRRTRYKVGIKVTHNLYRNRIKRAEVELYKEFNNLNVGTQGASFSATEEEYNKMKEIVERKTIKRV